MSIVAMSVVDPAQNKLWHLRAGQQCRNISETIEARASGSFK